MAVEEITKVLQETLKGVFQSGSRYYAENIAVILGFVILSVASIVWAFTGPDDTNELGADVYLRDVVVGFDLAVENSGRRAWTDVRIVLDKKYLFTADRIEGGEHLAIGSDRLRYAYHIPRPWGREEWEELSRSEKPGVSPRSDYVPSFVQIRSRQGRIDVELERTTRE